MKEFDLQKAKEGHPVCTRDERKARIVCFDLKNPLGYTVVACITDENGTDEILETYTDQGISLKGTTHAEDLFMVSKKREGWINIYPRLDDTCIGSIIYNSEHEAILASQNVKRCIATIKIEWEE